MKPCELEWHPRTKPNTNNNFSFRVPVPPYALSRIVGVKVSFGNKVNLFIEVVCYEVFVDAVLQNTECRYLVERNDCTSSLLVAGAL